MINNIVDKGLKNYEFINFIRENDRGLYKKFDHYEKKIFMYNKIKKRFADIGDLPSELVTNRSRMVMLGNTEFMIENYDGIIEYEVNRIRVSTASGKVAIIGEELTISELDNEELLVSGRIKSIELEGNE